ncbi:DUF3800 domain-containing protein [Cryobacterium mannosilyticum]|uniref:DUF3800 domain-containing protein n=1 Tax=Cryobacterium mannosilyticum TaxID=1259190 RepID=A0A4R8W6K9_9MICO|nr:DUF3800 domain-containing protein [Cryobacterium mannosilyticum]TFC03645.1 DUF3800 domain-containing protein [Cryobacterium mannosilyticum]
MLGLTGLDGCASLATPAVAANVTAVVQDGVMLHAFIDETGDRGITPRASDHFILTAGVVRDTNRHLVNPFLESIRTGLRKPSGFYLTWKNIRSHQDRVHIAQELGKQTWLKKVSVIACKRHLPATQINQSQIYLYQLRFMLERLSWLARTNNEVLHFTIAQIPRVSQSDLREYEHVLARQSGCQIHWASLDRKGGSIDQPQRLEELQLADLLASATGAAFNADRWGNTEQRYVQCLAPRLYRHGSSPLTSYGMKMHPWTDATKAAYPWIATL